jgi:hypothetical protein
VEIDAGLGPYAFQPGVPPTILNVGIAQNLVPLPAHDVSPLIPAGQSVVDFELLDLDGQIYGNTAVYLVPDCGVYVARQPATLLDFVSHDDQVVARPTEFDVQSGLLSHLRVDRDFSRATCLGHYLDRPVIDVLADPPGGDGYYYLARGLSSASCLVQGYGDARGVAPDPRDALDAMPVCP